MPTLDVAHRETSDGDLCDWIRFDRPHPTGIVAAGPLGPRGVVDLEPRGQEVQNRAAGGTSGLPGVQAVGDSHRVSLCAANRSTRLRRPPPLVASAEDTHL